MEEPQDLGQDQGSRDRPNEGSTDRLSGEQRHPTLVEIVLASHALVGRLILDGFTGVAHGLPDLGSRTGTRQGMETHLPEITVPPSQAGLNHHFEPYPVQRARALGVIEAAQGNPKLRLLSGEVWSCPAFTDG